MVKKERWKVSIMITLPDKEGQLIMTDHETSDGIDEKSVSMVVREMWRKLVDVIRGRDNVKGYLSQESNHGTINIHLCLEEGTYGKRKEK